MLWLLLLVTNVAAEHKDRYVPVILHSEWGRALCNVEQSLALHLRDRLISLIAFSRVPDGGVGQVVEKQ